MDFTQLSEFSPQKKQQKMLTSKPIMVSQSFSYNPVSQDLFSVLTDIDRINYQRSIPNNSILQGEDEIQMSESQELNEGQDEKKEDEIDFLPKPITLLSVRSSTIFHKSSTTTKSKPQSLKTEENTVKIYYLEQPIYKIVSYSDETTIKQLISKSLSLFISDKSQEQTLITSFNPQDYQLRFPQHEGSHLADFSFDAFESDRKLSEGVFQVLVLVLNPQKSQENRNISNSFQHRQSISEAITRRYHGVAKIRIFNQINMQIGNLTVSHENTLQQVFNYIECKQIYQHKYYITQNLTDDYQLPRDFLIKNLSSFKLYVKAKRYADQSSDAYVKPFSQNLISSLSQQVKNNILVPIGLTEASMYEEFPVIKINHRGVEQKRILGIDQMKVYNYEQKVRKQKAEPSFFSLIFGGNSETGTQKPYRLIKDIKKLKEQQNGFQIEYGDKSISYMVQNPQDKQKIIRKLTFLISFDQG